MASEAVCVRCGKTTENMRYGTSGPLCPDHAWTPPEIECTPTRLRILNTWHPEYGMIAGGIEVVLKINGRTGERKFAVLCRDHFQLDKDGDWQEASGWSDATRWDSREEAIAAATQAAMKIINAERKLSTNA